MLNQNTLNYFKNAKLHELVLGEDYLVWLGSRARLCTFIQPTEKGFNFLELSTSKCILKRHLYPSKKIGTGNTFFLHYSILLTKFPKTA